MVSVALTLVAKHLDIAEALQCGDGFRDGTVRAADAIRECLDTREAPAVPISVISQRAKHLHLHRAQTLVEECHCRDNYKLSAH